MTTWQLHYVFVSSSSLRTLAVRHFVLFTRPKKTAESRPGEDYAVVRRRCLGALSGRPAADL